MDTAGLDIASGVKLMDEIMKSFEESMFWLATILFFVCLLMLSPFILIGWIIRKVRGY